MKLMEDAFVIGCHAIEPGKAVWSDGVDRLATCSICKSLHPYEFMYQLLNGGFIQGWVWDDDKPALCRLDGGVFQAGHLTDMSEEWLLANAFSIFEHTGLVFFWDREELGWQAPFKGVRLGEGSAIVLTEEQHEWARKLIAEKFYKRQAP